MVALILAAGIARAQGGDAMLRGRVVDPMQMAIGGAVITVSGGSAPVVIRSDAQGQFAIALTAGTYQVTVTMEGFAPQTMTVVVRPGEGLDRRVLLPVAGVREDVTVTAPSAYRAPVITSATRTATPLRDLPQAVTVVTGALMEDQLMTSLADVMRYVPGVTVHQGENNRDQVIMRGNSSSADFFVNGVRDDVQYYRDLYNLERVEAVKGPNALAFGRGGAGGVINRVTKEAAWQPLREVFVQGGQFGNRRVTADVDQPVNSRIALRLNTMVEHSDSFRDGVDTSRGGINPAVTIQATDRTRVTAAYEFLRDRRVADRGITSVDGRPAGLPVGTYFGDPRRSHVRADVHLANAAIEHRWGRAVIRTRLQFADYGRFYQNFVPGAVSADRTSAALTAYNNATDRTSLFNQTDLLVTAATRGVEHTIVSGLDVGRQLTDNFRQTGFFNNTGTSVQVPLAAPATSVPVTFRQSAIDADNHLRATVAAAFVQDQVTLSRHLQLLGGVRLDRFDLRYHNNRTQDDLERPDTLVSPRVGVVVKPTEPLSLYASYSVSYLPSSGDQFSSLTTITRQVEPEKFSNYEVGAKWDTPSGLAVTAAVYRLDRTNTRSTDPNDPTRIVQTGAQRTNGVELGVTGAVVRGWTVAGGYAYQDAYVRSATSAARAGAVVGQVPHQTFSLWNTVRIHPRFSVGLGIVQRSDMFAAIDNTVVLPGYVKADAAAYFSLTPRTRLQINVENLTDKVYYLNADSNTNISPGYPRAVRIGISTRF